MTDNIIDEALVTKADRFAELAHGSEGQLRKYTGEPYIVHPREVAEIVRSVSGHTTEMICAALLHDTVEDCTLVEIEVIHDLFGTKIAGLVDWLTDVSEPSDGNRAVRKQKDRAHLAQASADAQTVKAADIISNSGSIVEHDEKFAWVYLAEAEKTLDILVRADAELLARARQTITDAQTDLVRRTLKQSYEH